MIIDAHHHYWKLDRGDYSWLTPDLEQLYRDYLPDDLTPHLDRYNVKGSVLVQAAPTVAETRFLLDLAKNSPSILGVVGWVDMDADDAIAQLDELIDYGGGYLKGVRPMVQDIEDVNWLLSNRLDRVFEAFAEREMVFDALVRPMHLSNLEIRLRKHKSLKVVIDHGGKPEIRHHVRSAWSDAMMALASNTNAYCKLSGLVTEAGEGWRAQDIRPYIANLIYCFGPERLIWGSDWPVLNLASNYNDWWDLAQLCCGHLRAKERELIFGGNAREIYALDVLCPQP